MSLHYGNCADTDAKQYFDLESPKDYIPWNAFQELFIFKTTIRMLSLLVVLLKLRMGSKHPLDTKFPR